MNAISSVHQMVNSFPMLVDGEEEALWQEYFDEGTKRSRRKQIREKIITSHLRLALKGAKKWIGSKLPLEDLYGQAQEGLIQAFDKFSPEHGTKFATYAPWWIRAKVETYVMDNAYSYRIGTTQFAKYLFFNYTKIKNELETENPDLNADQIDVLVAKKLIADEKSQSDDLEKTLTQIKDYKIKRSSMSSLDAPISDDGESSSYVDLLADPNARPVIDSIEEEEEKTIGREFLLAARDKLKQREWEILKARRLDDPIKTLEDLSEVYGVSRERVRQIEVRAFEKLQVFAKNDFGKVSAIRTKGRAVKRKKQTSSIPIPHVPERKQTNPVRRIKPAKSISNEPVLKGSEQLSVGYINQKLKYDDLISRLNRSHSMVPIVKGREKTIIGYFIWLDTLSSSSIPRDNIAYSLFKKKSADYSEHSSLIVFGTKGKEGDIAFISASLFPSLKNEISKRPSKTVEPEIAPTVAETKVDTKNIEEPIAPSKTKPQPKIKAEVTVKRKPPISTEGKPSDMIKKLRSLDLEEEYPYIPKSVGFDEMVGAVHHFALGKRDFFERSSRVINGIEHPKEGRWVYVGPSVGQPQIDTRYSSPEEWNVIRNQLLGIKTIANEEIKPRKERVIITAENPKQIDEIAHAPSEPEKERQEIINGFSFRETRSVPYKPYTLTLGSDDYHMSAGDKKIIEHLLEAGEPQSKEQLSASGMSFHGPLQKKLKDMGLLKVYKKEGVPRTTFYSVATDTYKPNYPSYYLRGESAPKSPNTAIAKTSVKRASVKAFEGEPSIKIDALNINPSSTQVTYEGTCLEHVTGKPFEALILMAKKHGDFVSREDLSQHFFGDVTPENMDRVDMGMKSLAHMIDRSIANLAQSIIMKVGDKGYALTLSIEERSAVYSKAGLVDPLAKRKVSFPSPHTSQNNASTGGAIQPKDKRTVADRKPQASERLSMADQLARLKLG